MRKLIQKLAKLYVSSGQQDRDKKIMESSRNLLLEDMLKQSGDVSSEVVLSKMLSNMSEDFYSFRKKHLHNPSVLWVSFECRSKLEAIPIDSLDPAGVRRLTFMGAEVRHTMYLDGISWVFDYKRASDSPWQLRPKPSTSGDL